MILEITQNGKRVAVGSMAIPGRKRQALVCSYAKNNHYEVMAYFKSKQAAKAFDSFLSIVEALGEKAGRGESV